MYQDVLIAPDGREVTVTSPGEYNDLRYGKGYRPKPPPPPPRRKTKTPESS